MGLGDFLSDILGTNSAVGVNGQDPYQAIQPWQQGQKDLAGMLQGQAAGTSGPNPAQMQYLQNSQSIAQAQATQNAQNRAINPGLAARMSGNQAIASGQQAAGQAGIQQAQQQLASQQLLGTTLAQGAQGANQAGAVNAGIAAGNQQQAGKEVGGVMGGAGVLMGMAHGGEVRNYASGGSTGMAAYNPQATESNGAMSMAGQFMNRYSEGMGSSQPGASQGDGLETGMKDFTAGLGHSMGIGKGAGGMSDDIAMDGMTSGGAAEAMGMDDGGLVQTAMKLAPLIAMMNKGGFAEAYQRKNSPHTAALKAMGGHVPGKAKVSGDSPKNDVVKTNLSAGEIVIPRSIALGENAPEMAAQFVAAVKAKEKTGGRAKK